MKVENVEIINKVRFTKEEIELVDKIDTFIRDISTLTGEDYGDIADSVLDNIRLLDSRKKPDDEGYYTLDVLGNFYNFG